MQHSHRAAEGPTAALLALDIMPICQCRRRSDGPLLDLDEELVQAGLDDGLL
jgi:hypothetical protein